MALISLRPGAFRTRNPGRDAETDQARIETVRNAILMALADARRERDGLKQRMSMYYAQAASMLDTSEDYGTRAAADEAKIRVEGSRHHFGAAQIEPDPVPAGRVVHERGNSKEAGRGWPRGTVRTACQIVPAALPERNGRVPCRLFRFAKDSLLRRERRHERPGGY